MVSCILCNQNWILGIRIYMMLYRCVPGIKKNSEASELSSEASELTSEVSELNSEASEHLWNALVDSHPRDAWTLACMHAWMPVCMHRHLLSTQNLILCTRMAWAGIAKRNQQCLQAAMPRVASGGIAKRSQFCCFTASAIVLRPVGKRWIGLLLRVRWFYRTSKPQNRRRAVHFAPQSHRN